jgi:hypothetical protein
MRIAITPSDLGTAYEVPPTTNWYVFVNDTYPSGIISIMPAVEGGLPGFFQHQARAFPDEKPGQKWRDAKICVATNTENNLYNTSEIEPTTSDDRLAYQVGRAIEWVRRASHGTLIAAGEPFEMPFFTEASARPVAFWEGPETLETWGQVTQQFGLVDLVRLGTHGGCLVAREFESPSGKTLVVPPWGAHIAGSRTSAKGVWVRFPALPILPPWAAPVTWGELREAATLQGFDLDTYLRPALELALERRIRHLLVGFAVEETIGGDRMRYQWQPATLTISSNARRRRRGSSRRHRRSPWVFDYQIAASDDSPIHWLWGTNWHPDQIGSRGRLPEALRDSRVLLIGAGSLGSMVGEMLVRGGVKDITILDPDVVEAGNLVRHTLTLDDVQGGKAEALAARLNRSNPNAVARGFKDWFPTLAETARGHVNRADLVIESTGLDFVIEALGWYPWPSPRRFLSTSVLYGAEKLLLFVADAAAFPTQVFREQVDPWLAKQRDEHRDMPHEGVGCWHPVFPARADDMFLLASATVRALSDWPYPSGPLLRVLERSGDAQRLPALNLVEFGGT